MQNYEGGSRDDLDDRVVSDLGRTVVPVPQQEVIIASDDEPDDLTAEGTDTHYSERVTQSPGGVRGMPETAAPDAPDGGGPTDSSPGPEVSETTPAAPERVATRNELRIEALGRVRGEQDGSDRVLNSPTPGEVVNAARRGETQRLTVTRDPGTQEVRFVASRSLVPEGATVTEIDPTSATQHDEAEQKFTSYARLVPERRPRLDEKTGQGAKQDESGMRIERALSEYKGPVRVVIHGRSVSPDVHDQLSSVVGDELHDAEQTYSMASEVPHLKEFSQTLEDAKQTALIHRAVAVGVPEGADLDYVSRLVASQGFQSGERITWTVETDAQGNVVKYDTEAEALAAAEDDPNSFITAQQFRNEATLPTEEVPGFNLRDREVYAVNRNIPHGVPSIPVGEILDNTPNADGTTGQPVGELRITEKDLKRHGLIAATTGSGKTVLMRQIAVGAVKEDYERNKAIIEAGGTPTHRAVVIVDLEKVGNWDELGGQLAAQGLPPDRASVHCITPGAEGIRANVNLLRLTGERTPHEQVATATLALSSNLKEDAVAVRVFEKYASAAIERAYQKLGWNMNTNKSGYPFGPPATPDMELVSACVEEIMSETTFRSDTKGDLGSFTESTLKQALRGIPGQLFQGGYDIDWEAVRNNKGITVIQLGRIEGMDAKRIALTAIMRGLAAQLEGEVGGRDTDDTKALLMMDETGGIFDKHSSAGAANANFFSNIRGKSGIAAIIAQQGSIADLHEDVLNNTNNFWAMKLNNRLDIAEVASRMGVSTARLLATAREGRGLYIGLGMDNGPVRFRTTNPKDIRSEPDVVALGPERLIDKGFDRDLYTGATKAEARDFLVNQRTGTLVRAWAEMNAGLVPLGRDPLEIAGKLKAELRAMKGTVDQPMRDCALTMAAVKAVDSRPEIMHAMTRKELIEYLVDDMRAQVDGTPRPERQPFELQLNVGTYSAAKDAVVEAMIADPVDNQTIRDALGKKVPGSTATDQQDALARMEQASARVVAGTVKADLAQLSDDAIETATRELKRLVGGRPIEQAIDAVKASIETALTHELTDSERVIFAGIVEKLADSIAENEEVVGYPEVRRMIEAEVEAAAGRPAVDLSALSEEVYHEALPGLHDDPNMTAEKQLKEIEKMEQAMLLKARYKVVVSNLLFAHDLMLGGQTLNNIVGSLLGEDQLQGNIYEAQRRLHNSGQPESLSLLDLLKNKDPRHLQWGERIGRDILRSPNFKMPNATKQFLLQWVGDHIRSLQQQAQLWLEKQQTGGKK